MLSKNYYATLLFVLYYLEHGSFAERYSSTQ